MQNLLGAKLFNIDESQILIGNGAAELIRALAVVIKGKIGVIYPTFNEYEESFIAAGGEVIQYIPQNFSYTVSELKTFSKNCDAIILINPDNPSGNYILHNDVIELALTLKSEGKKLILDESFIDFSDTEENPSLLCQDILNSFPNIIVVKSLSKSYGIPGIRLGVLASGDEELVKQIRKHLSIWNINSFGEYFLQIIGKYQKDYKESCKKISKERERFKALLDKIEAVNVYPSQANYLLCKFNGISSPLLTEILLNKHEIFIKDLTGKAGIPDDSYARIAIRGTEDNNTFLTRLKEVLNDNSF